MEVKQWVSDYMMKQFGMSEKTIVEYILVLSQSAKSPDQLADSLLTNADLPDNNQTRAFANELYHKVPRKAKKLQSDTLSRKVKDKETIKVLQKNDSFKLLLDDDEDQDIQSGLLQKKPKKDKKTKKSRTKEPGNAWESDPEDGLSVMRKKQKEAKEKEQEQDEFELAEIERAKDAKERDEFAARVLEKDKARTKKTIIEDKSSAADQESQKRKSLFNDQEAREKALPELREISRQKYLPKRVEQHLELLRRKIRDDEELFRDDELTARELRDRKYNKEALRLAEERNKINVKEDRYQVREKT